MKKTMLALAVAGIAAMTAANASNWATPNAGSFYLGADIGAAHFTQSGNGFTGLKVKQNNVFGGIYAGYQFTHYLALELGSQYYGNFKVENPVNDNQLGKVQLATYLTVAAKGDIPLFYHFDIYGEVGAAWAHAKLDGTGFSLSKNRVAPLIGAGVEYAITPNLSARIGYQYLYRVMDTSYEGTDYKANVNNMFFGMAYRFGDQSEQQANIQSAEPHMMHNKMAMNHQVHTVSGMTVDNVNYNDLSGATTQSFRGVRVVSVKPDSLAANIGLQPGDIILGMNDYRVLNIADLNKLSQTNTPTTTVDVLRGPDGNSKLIQLEARKFNISAATLFAYNSAVIDTKGQDELMNVLSNVRQYHMKDATYIVKGYAGPIGSAQYNVYLSKKRANSVAKFLEAHGVSAQSISTYGFGATDLVVTPKQVSNLKGQAYVNALAPNRRVIITVDSVLNRTSTVATAAQVQSYKTIPSYMLK